MGALIGERKMKYEVIVQHTVSRTLWVEAQSEDEAQDSVEELMCHDSNFWDEDYNDIDFFEDWFINEVKR